jgi:DNA polymerase
MPLSLDTRQRAMLLEMGVRVWLPGTDFALADSSTLPGAVQSQQPSPQGVLHTTPNAQAPQAGLPAQRPIPANSVAPATAGGRDAGLASRSGGTASSAPAVPRGDGANDLSQIATMDWDALARTAADCQACGLCAGRSHSVLSAQAGRRARWMVVGDPPDEDEDAAGQPFTGEAGLLLANMLKAVGATRGELAPGLEAAYVTKVSKCRPPQGRVPQAAELAQCAAYLQREIALVQPSVILAMGRFANQVLLQEHLQEAALPLGRQRGQVYRYQGVPVLVTYTPQALLRQPADKAKAWADLCQAMDLLQTLA